MFIIPNFFLICCKLQSHEDEKNMKEKKHKKT